MTMREAAGFLASVLLLTEIAFSEGSNCRIPGPQQKVELLREIFPFGVPSEGPIVEEFTSYILNYDESRKTAVWVAEHFNRSVLSGRGRRNRSSFHTDRRIPVIFRSSILDYRRSGYVRGHLAGAAGHKRSQCAMDDTFALSNIIPQNKYNNMGYWNLMETYARDLAKRYSNIYVLSGPLYLSRSIGKRRYVIYEVIGKNRVAVPTHLFKVILASNNDNPTEPLMGAFVVPNKPIALKYSLTSFKVKLRKLEELSGLKLLPKLNHNNLRDLCKEDGCDLTKTSHYRLILGGYKPKKSKIPQMMCTSLRS